MSTSRRTASLLLALTLLLAACGGAAETDDTASTVTTPDDPAATEAAETATETDVPASGEIDPAVCDATASVVELIGNASNPENDSDQIRDAVELMGQAVIQLEDAGADPAVVEAADTIHAEFAAIVGDPDALPDLATIEAAGAVLGGVLGSCGITDIGGTTGADTSSDADIARALPTDPTTCAATDAFVTAALAFSGSEAGSREEIDAVGEMEVAAFAFADAVDDPELVQSVFTLYEDAQQFVETGEFGDVGGEGMLVDSLFQTCVDEGLIDAA